MRHSTLFALALSLSSCLPSFAGDMWDIDSKHSSANFVVKHMMVTNVRGQMAGISGSAKYDGKNIDGLEVEADLDASTISTGDAGRDDHLRGADFFDVTKYPKIHFKSTGSLPVREVTGGAVLSGKLTMHGITKDVELRVIGPTDPIKDFQGNTKIGASATTTVNRKDFGITYNKALDNGGVAVGENVQITLEIELTKRPDAKVNSTMGNTPDAKKAKKEAI